MNKSLLSTITLAFLLSPLASLLAASATSDVTVRVLSVDKLTVTDGGTITLDGTAGSNDLGPTTDATAVLQYTHNKGATKKITAEASTSPAAASNDLVLSVEVAGGAGAKTVYNDSGATGVQDVVTSIGAGALANKTVTYSAQATASGTTVSADTDFSFTITFTSVDE